MKNIAPLTPEQQALVGTDDVMRLANYFVRYYQRWYRNYDDELQSAALLGAVRGTAKFRNIHNRHTYMRYTRDWMRAYMNVEARKIRKHGIKYNRGDLKIHAEMKRHDFDELDFCPDERDSPDITDMLNRVCRYLNCHEERIIRKVYGEGMSIPEAATFIPSDRRGYGSVSEQYARQLHRTALEKIRKYFPTPLHLMYGAA